MGLSRREFAKSEGCTEGAVRYALKQGRLVVRPDGTLDASQLGGRWRLNTAGASKRRAKREASTAQTARVTQVSAQIPFDVSIYYGWNHPEFDPETEEGFGLMLGLKEEYRKDPESIGHSMMMHGVSLVQREAYRFGWRKDGPKPPTVDADSLGPEERFSDLTDLLLNFGLVRKLGRAMQSDRPDADDPIDINDPVIVAELMVFLASDILEQELKRRRREAGAVGPRDRMTSNSESRL
jgi:hypothetical protein